MIEFSQNNPPHNILEKKVGAIASPWPLAIRGAFDCKIDWERIFHFLQYVN